MLIKEQNHEKNTKHPVSNIKLIKNMTFEKITNSKKTHDFLNNPP